ncbi:MAG TPA: acetylxylan esterase [Verrucomicrobiae bacterium]|nr:acetylxylan esterase [Verrucomicrobiae bacterium]
MNPFAKIFRSFVLILALAVGIANMRAANSFPDVAALPSHPEIPNPLVMFDGTPVTNATQWFEQRRPELKALFQNYMYGVMPSAPEYEHFKIERVDKHFFGGKATAKEVTIQLFKDINAPAIHLLVVTPNTHPNSSSSLEKKSRGFPVFLGMNFCGNHTLASDTNIALPASWMAEGCPGCIDYHATDAGRGAQVNVWNIKRSIDRGYAVATFYYGDIEPDTNNATTGLRAWLAQHAGSAPNRMPPTAGGDIAIWAWSLSRAADYLVTDQTLDAKRIAVVGHSRLGKATILAAAFDERFAVAMPLQAGCGGTAPSRGKIGESVKVINQSFPHWFNDAFKKFGGDPSHLPFDQDCLIALVAPRPVVIGQTTEDTWSNPTGTFEMLQAAEPVYRLLGVNGLDAQQAMPETNQLVGDHLAYFIRPGKHSMTTLDWKFFLDYADRMLP